MIFQPMKQGRNTPACEFETEFFRSGAETRNLKAEPKLSHNNLDFSTRMTEKRVYSYASRQARDTGG
jgi:hypothetical protein